MNMKMKLCVLLVCVGIGSLCVPLVCAGFGSLPTIPMTLSFRYDHDASSGIYINCTVSNSGGTEIAQLLSPRKWTSSAWLNATDKAILTSPTNPGIWPCPGTWDSSCERMWIAEPISLGCAIANHDTASYNYFTFKLHPSPSWNGTYDAGWTAADENYVQSCNSQPCDATGCYSTQNESRVRQLRTTEDSHWAKGLAVAADAIDGYVIPGLVELVMPLTVANEVYFLQQYRYIHPNIFYIQIYAQ